MIYCACSFTASRTALAYQHNHRAGKVERDFRLAVENEETSPYTNSKGRRKRKTWCASFDEMRASATAPTEGLFHCASRSSMLRESPSLCGCMMLIAARSMHFGV